MKNFIKKWKARRILKKNHYCLDHMIPKQLQIVGFGMGMPISAWICPDCKLEYFLGRIAAVQSAKLVA